MEMILSILVVLGFICLAAFLQLSAAVWAILIGGLLLLLFIFGFLSLLPFVILAVPFFCVAMLANLAGLRQRYILKPTLARLRKQLPSISRTERDALEAGNTWWEKELFSGRPTWHKLYAMPKPSLTQDEQDFLANQVEQLCSMICDWKIVYQDRDLPKEAWDYLKREKFFGLVIPKKYGGLGFSAVAHSTIVTKIATRSVSAAVNTMVPNSLGPAELLLHYGTEEQKNYYLPRLAVGDEIPCFALTAPDAGSDAGAIPDIGIISRGKFNGEEIIGINLTWDKRYITLAPIATVLGLAFQLYDPMHLLGDNENLGITLCLLPATHPGVDIGTRHLPMHLAFMNGPTRGKDVFIPLDWIIGGPKMAGHGWRMLMECLSIGRSISLPALATACGKGTYRYTGAYSRIRKQFNIPIASFEGIEEALGNIAGYTYMLEATRLMTALAVDMQLKPSIASAIAKYHMTEMSRKVIAHAMDIHAGHMIQAGPRNFLAHVHFAVPISITVEGANILTRNLIIFGQGAIRCHPYILQEIALISADQPDIAQLDKVLMGHVGFYTSNFLRSLVYGLTGGFFIIPAVKHKKIKKYQRQLTRMSTALALLADTSLILLGGSLKRRERLSARLGDILSHLYLSSAVLKYFDDNQSPETDVEYVIWSLQSSLYQIQVACEEIFVNFPIKWLGKFLSFIIFPFGKTYRQPNDLLYKNMVSAMLSPSELRDRLTKYCYNSNQQDDLFYRLDKALTLIANIDPIWKKLHQAVQSGIIKQCDTMDERINHAQEKGIISMDEAKSLTGYEILRNEIIKVNEFSFDLAKVIA